MKKEYQNVWFDIVCFNEDVIRCSISGFSGDDFVADTRELPRFF